MMAEIEVTGNTYPFRKILKARYNLRWNRRRNSFYSRMDTKAPTVRRLRDYCQEFKLTLKINLFRMTPMMFLKINILIWNNAIVIDDIVASTPIGINFENNSMHPKVEKPFSKIMAKFPLKTYNTMSGIPKLRLYLEPARIPIASANT